MRLCEGEPYLCQMDCWYLVILVCLGRCCLLAPPSSFFWHWFLPSLPLGCSALSSSRSWFCLVRHSTAAARVWTCLSKVVVRGLSPWLLVVVAIKQVSTMQLFVQEAISMAYFLIFPIDKANWWCQKSPISRTVLTCSRQHLHNTEQEDLRRVPVWYWPKTLRRLS